MRHGAVTVATVAVLLAFAACTPSEVGNAPLPSRPDVPTSVTHIAGKPFPEALIQDLLPGRRLPALRSSNLPRSVSVPPTKVTSVLDDPPGHVLMVTTPLDEWFAAESFADHTNYFYGLDGKWRSLNMAELGIPDSDWAGPDGSGSGALSPSGSLWAFHTASKIGVVDLATGNLRLHALPQNIKPSSPAWIAGQGLVVGVYRRGHPGFVMNPWSGEVHRRPETGLPTRWTTGPAWVARDVDSAGKQLVTVRRDGTRRVKRLPFRWPGSLDVRESSDTRLVLYSDGVARTDEGQPLQHSHLLVVDAHSLEPTAGLKLNERHGGGVFDALFGWANEEAYVLRHGQNIVAWFPDDERITTLTRVSGQVITRVAIESLRIRID